MGAAAVVVFEIALEYVDWSILRSVVNKYKNQFEMDRIRQNETGVLKAAEKVIRASIESRGNRMIRLALVKFRLPEDC